MAKRRRRKRAALKNAAPRRRRRRRNPGALGPVRRRAVASNPRRRRRRTVRANPRRHVRRRHARRNPPILGSARGVVGGIVQGLKDGGAVVLGQVGARKVSGAVKGILPASAAAQVSTGLGQVALSLASAVVVSIVAKKALPGQARMITAGAFSETINSVLAKTPVAPYLAAYPRRAAVAANPRHRLGAWTGATPAVGMGAYPGGMRSVGMPSNAGM